MATIGFKNFQAISRKPNLIAFGLFPYSANLDWILGDLSTLITYPLVGAQDGSNRAFQVQGLNPLIMKNGILQNPGVGNDYTISSGVVIFAIAPQADDWLRELNGNAPPGAAATVVTWGDTSTPPDGVRSYFVFPVLPIWCSFGGTNQYQGTGYTVATVGGEIRVTFIDTDHNPIVPDSTTTIKEAI